MLGLCAYYLKHYTTTIYSYIGVQRSQFPQLKIKPLEKWNISNITFRMGTE